MIKLKKAVRSLTLANKIGFEDGTVGNCRWRCFGPDCCSDARGQLHLANNKEFDRWANSRMITIDCAMLIQESRSLTETLEHLVKAFD